MKKNAMFLLGLLFSGAILLSQNWIPEEFQKMEAKLLELKNQVLTLDEYAPKKFPEFEKLERSSQLIELIEYGKKKFTLLIEQYNLVEDNIFPFLSTYYREHPEHRNRIIVKAREYTNKNEKSILEIQKEINHTALQITRLKNELERSRTLARALEIAEEKKESSRGTAQTIDISARISRLREKRSNFSSDWKIEIKKLAKLKVSQNEFEAKIKEKRAEVQKLKDKTAGSRDALDQLLNRTATQVREIRLNGLEIPRLNTVKTFIYLSENRIETLKLKIQDIDREVVQLKKQRKNEFQKKLLKGIVIIIIAFFLVVLLIRIFRQIGKRLIKRIELSTAISPHRKQRYNTLFSILLSIIKIALWILAVLWVLGELNIDYTPFLVAAGGVSLAIGFGAQSLVKDIVAGFFILMEEQLALGDVIEIDGKTGTVEKISLRTIRIRSLNGTLHIIPNGSITNVSNLTHQWSRAVIEVGVSYDENSENVLAVLQNICQDIYEDRKWQPLLIEQPVPQGILSFGDSAINFRVLAKTVPGKQWDVDREMKNRIKKTFDREGIEIPYPFTNIVDRTDRPDES
jgi:small conductance mechanosensitive channel